ncbi:uncharacterized protein RSE6_12027 [Rhynchosporium secalis]|uniref:Uncharacterized protein n=1 Tax=Rhynchosporium secalis TaxID=38038 RepID=A0A1E1MPD6_RHYSE|nr:uncharacterized protein RSE6_12027 [Rhynchosporium secalis]
MMLSGLEIITRKLVLSLRNVAIQQQPCGVDLRLRQISKWTIPGTLDFSNSKRQAAHTSILPFTLQTPTSTSTPQSKIWRK